MPAPASSRTPEDGLDPAATFISVAAGVESTQSYVSPTDGERGDAGTGLARLAIGDIDGARTVLGPLGFAITADVDPATGRRYAMAVSETATARAWGVYLVDLSAPLRLSVAVPHPKSDLHCEELALRLWRAAPGSMLAMAAVHRCAEDRTADHAQNTASVFHHLWTRVLGPRGVPQVQIHGFRDTSAPEQIVVSTGAGPVSAAAERIADEIAATGRATTRSWDGTAATNLDATTNQQGIAANTDSWIWVHVEHNRTVRDTTTLWHPAIDAIAAADPALLAHDRPSPGGPGHFPQSIGSANTTGTSRYFAREDHIHRGATQTHTVSGPVARSAPVTLTDDATISADASLGDYFRIALGGDRRLAAPTNGADGQRIYFEALASGTDCTLTFDPAILVSTGITSPIAIASGKRWFGSLVYIGDVGWMIIVSTTQS